jgi:hypothetical protein
MRTVFAISACALFLAPVTSAAGPEAAQELSSLEGRWGYSQSFLDVHDFPGVAEGACDRSPRRIEILTSGEVPRVRVSSPSRPQASITSEIIATEDTAEGLRVSLNVDGRTLYYLLRDRDRLEVSFQVPGASGPQPGLPLERCPDKAFF